MKPTPPPPPPPVKSAASADRPKAQRKLPWSKPTIRLHDGVIDVESGAVSHPFRGDNQDPNFLYAPISA